MNEFELFQFFMQLEEQTEVPKQKFHNKTNVGIQLLAKSRLFRFSSRNRYTSTRTHSIGGLEILSLRWTKISGLETTIFGSKMMVKSGLEKNTHFEILLAPSEITANWPGQFSLTGQIFFCTGQQL